MAWRLGGAGHRVTAVARAPYVRAVRERGLLVEQAGRATRAVGLRAVEQTDVLGDAHFDLVLITCKAFDTAVSAVLAQPFVQSGARALILQNGVGGVEVARSILGEECLSAGVVTIPVEVPKPAVIRPHLRRGGIGVAPVSSGKDDLFLTQLLSLAQFDVRSYANWRSMAWSKLMLNMLANAIPAILDRPLDQLYADRRLYELERASLREARAVVQRLGIRFVPLPGYPVPILVWLLCAWPAGLTHALFRRAILGGRGGKPPSLHADLTRGRTGSEVAFLNGAVVRAGDKLGLATPVNRALCDTLTGIVEQEIAWVEYQGQAERLIQRAFYTGSPT
jgi:2-dehydropantoate 2-reductase